MDGLNRGPRAVMLMQKICHRHSGPPVAGRSVQRCWRVMLSKNERPFTGRPGMSTFLSSIDSLFDCVLCKE